VSYLTCIALQIREKTIDYTDECRQTVAPYSRCSEFLKNNTGDRCLCQIRFNLTENFEVCTNVALLYIVFVVTNGIGLYQIILHADSDRVL